MGLPANTKFCNVTARFLRAVADGADEDLNPDGLPVAGLKITFTSSLTPATVTNASEKVTFVVDPVVCTTDEAGYMIGPNGLPGVRLVASNDPSMNKHDWTWRVEVSGPTFPRVTFDFVAPVDGTVDLSTVIPVPSSPGAQITQWQAVVEPVVAARAEVFQARADVLTAIESFDPGESVNVDAAVESYLTANPTTKASVGLANVDNTADSVKPISAAQQAALDAKVPTTRTIAGKALTGNITLAKADVGLSAVDNTADVNKPVSTAQAAAIANAPRPAVVTWDATTRTWGARPAYATGGTIYQVVNDPTFDPIEDAPETANAATGDVLRVVQGSASVQGAA